MALSEEIIIRECDTVGLLEGCVDLQRRVFDLPEIELSPVRHFIVTMHAGGFTLGAFSGQRLIGFCLSVPAVLNGERALYSHMTAIDGQFQGHGIGARLKWTQREYSLDRGINLIKWTFQPEKARNAFFNLEKLGAEVRDYKPNFYGTDYGSQETADQAVGIQSDRLFALWRLDSERVRGLATGKRLGGTGSVAASIGVPREWGALLAANRAEAAREQHRIRNEFESAFAKGFVCRGFRRDADGPAYLLYET